MVLVRELERGGTEIMVAETDGVRRSAHWVAERHPPAWIGDLLTARDRTRAAPTFAPDGLYLTGAEYLIDGGSTRTI